MNDALPAVDPAQEDPSGAQLVQQQVPGPGQLYLPVGLPLGGYANPTGPKPRRQRKVPKVKTLPTALDAPGRDSNEAFAQKLEDINPTISPQALGFRPASYWLNTSLTFGDLVNKFFHRKNNSSCRFPHKLYNALALVDSNESYWPLVGVKWVTDCVFMVDKIVFGRLLGIGSFDGGLFHRQGNFPSHSFVEVQPDTLGGIPGLEIDGDRYRLFQHSSGLFKKVCSDDFFNSCKWVSM
jgi:hypothetical protein